MKTRRKKMPLRVLMMEKLPSKRIRLFFSTGKLLELSAIVIAKAKLISHGLAVDLGDGRDVCAETLHAQARKMWTS